MALVEKEPLRQLKRNHIIVPQGTLDSATRKTGMLEFAFYQYSDSSGGEQRYPQCTLCDGGEVEYRIGKPLTLDGDARYLLTSIRRLPAARRSRLFRRGRDLTHAISGFWMSLIS